MMNTNTVNDVYRDAVYSYIVEEKKDRTINIMQNGDIQEMVHFKWLWFQKDYPLSRISCDDVARKLISKHKTFQPLSKFIGNRALKNIIALLHFADHIGINLSEPLACETPLYGNKKTQYSSQDSVSLLDLIDFDANYRNRGNNRDNEPVTVDSITIEPYS